MKSPISDHQMENNYGKTMMNTFNNRDSFSENNITPPNENKVLLLHFIYIYPTIFFCFIVDVLL